MPLVKSALSTILQNVGKGMNGPASTTEITTAIKTYVQTNAIQPPGTAPNSLNISPASGAKLKAAAETSTVIGKQFTTFLDFESSTAAGLPSGSVNIPFIPIPLAIDLTPETTNIEWWDACAEAIIAGFITLS